MSMSDITSVLIQYTNRTNFQALSMPRNINENTDLQAASPAIEINRLYDNDGCRNQGTANAGDLDRHSIRHFHICFVT